MSVYYIAYPLIVALSTLILYSSLESNFRKEMRDIQKPHVVMKFPSAFIAVFVTGFFLFAAFSILAAKQSDLIGLLGMLMFALPSLLLSIYCLAFRIDFYRDKDYFMYKSLLKKKTKINYFDCEKLEWDKDKESFKIKTYDGKSFYVPDCVNCFEDLRVKMIQSKVKEVIPQKKRKKVKLTVKNRKVMLRINDDVREFRLFKKKY